MTAALAAALCAVGLILAAAMAGSIYLVIRGEYLQLPDDKPVNELDALSRLLNSFARFSVRSRRMIRALAIALVIDFVLSGAYGYLAVQFENQHAQLARQRCIPYHLIDKTNAGIRHFLDFSLGRAESSKTSLPPTQQAQINQIKAEESADFPPAPCPKN